MRTRHDRDRGSDRRHAHRFRRRRLPLAVAVIACSPGCTPSEAPSPSEEARPTREEVTRAFLEPLTREEIRRLGVARFGWQRGSPPGWASREDLIESFVTAETYTDAGAATRTRATRRRLEPLTREQIWRQGVERFGWRREEPPPDASKAELIRFFLIDERFEDWVDPAYNDWDE